MNNNLHVPVRKWGHVKPSFKKVPEREKDVNFLEVKPYIVIDIRETMNTIS